MKITHVYDNKPYVKLNECRMFMEAEGEFSHAFWAEGVSFKSSLDLDDTICVVSKQLFESYYKEWTPDFSKYIPEDGAVLFLSEEDIPFSKTQFAINNQMHYPSFELFKNSKDKPHKLTMFAKEINSDSLQKSNNISKELKEQYYVEWVGLCSKDCLLEIGKDYKKLCNDGLYRDKLESGLYTMYKPNEGKDWHDSTVFIDQLITTNSTGILEPQDTERLKVIDWKEWFKDVK